jgi:hypothetical protein
MVDYDAVLYADPDGTDPLADALPTAQQHVPAPSTD